MEKIRKQIECQENMSKFIKDMDQKTLEEMHLLRPISYIFDFEFGSIIPESVLTKLLDSGDVINVIPGVWWVDGGKKKFTLNPLLPYEPPTISGTLDNKEWSGFLELISLFM